MDGMFGLVAYEASDDEEQTSSQPSDNAKTTGGMLDIHSLLQQHAISRSPPTRCPKNTAGVVLLTGHDANGAEEQPEQDTGDDVEMTEAQEAAAGEDDAAAAATSHEDADAQELQRLQAILPPEICNPPEATCDPELQVCCCVGCVHMRTTLLPRTFCTPCKPCNSCTFCMF